MPCKQCSDNGKRGWRWGDRGKCFTGPGALTKCKRQGRAIRASGFRGQALVEILLFFAVLAIFVAVMMYL